MKNREIEKKLRLISPRTQATADRVIEKVYGRGNCIAKRETGLSLDLFWRSPNVDFERLRKFQDGRGELTTKLTDKGTVVDRVEINVEVSYTDALEYMTLTRGEPCGEITKSYNVFWISYPKPAIISTYKVVGDKQVYLEVEADDLDTVNMVLKDLTEYFDWEQETRSLFEIFIGPQRDK